MPVTNRKKNIQGQGGTKNVAQSYNRFKTFGGREYTGMTVGRSHKWNYDKGVWRDIKISPDLWGISYAVTKRRAGHAPAGSGASVGTDYHWVILAHQHVEKLNPDDYSTVMTGLKFKLAHRRGNSDKWSLSATAQRKHLITFLEDMIAQLKRAPVPLEIDVDNISHKGEAMPIMEACSDGKCDVYDITLDDQHLGLLRRLKSGWKMDIVEDQKLIKALGKALEAHRVGDNTEMTGGVPLPPRKKKAASSQ
jgi:hypothetical protein